MTFKSMKITRQDAIAKTILAWEFLEKTGCEDKRDVPVIMDHCPLNDCFLCEYTVNDYMGRDTPEAVCEKCPVTQAGFQACDETGSFFETWDEAHGFRAKMLAAKSFLDWCLRVLK